MPCPKDPIKLLDYRKKMSEIAKKKGYGKWMKGKTSCMLGKKHTFEAIEKMKIANKENAIKYGYGKWMKGRKNTPFLKQKGEQARLRKGKTYKEIYGKRAWFEKAKRKLGNKLHWVDKIRKTDIRPKHNSDYQYVEWRKFVFRRDNYTCQKCGIKNEKELGKTVILHAHHLKSWSKHLELRYETDNGITFCALCHKQHHKENGIL